MTKHDERNLAVKLRKEGYSYTYIQKKTGVSKSTLSVWLSSISYTPNKETVSILGKARAKSGEVKAEIKRKSVEKAQQIAKKEVGTLSKRDLFMLGLGIYIGEGTKSHNVIRVINADPNVINTSLAWFKKVCGLKNENFSIRLHLYPDSDEPKCVTYWSKVTGLSKNNFQRTLFDKRKKNPSKRGKLPYGTAHVTIKSNGNKEFGVFFSRKITAWMSEVHKKAGLV